MTPSMAARARTPFSRAKAMTRVFGDNGNDIAFLGAGNDTFTWAPGDGSDTIEGEAGIDTMDFDGSGAAENITISANGQRVNFFRDVANVTMDMDGVERIGVRRAGWRRQHRGERSHGHRRRRNRREPGCGPGFDHRRRGGGLGERARRRGGRDHQGGQWRWRQRVHHGSGGRRAHHRRRAGERQAGSACRRRQ